MKKVIKWILGIVVVLVILAAVAGVGYLVIGRWGNAHWMMNVRSFQPWGDGREGRQFEMPMHPGWGMPMGRNGWFPMQRFGGFFPLGLIFGGLFWAAVIFLSVVGVISLFRGRKGARQAVVSTAAEVSTVSTTPSTSVATATTVEEPSQAPALTCANCGRTIEEDWGHCPYCGHKLK